MYQKKLFIRHLITCTFVVVVVPPLEYFEIHTDVLENPQNNVRASNNSLCARINKIDEGDKSNFTVRCLNTKQTTSLAVCLKGATRHMKLCEVDII